MKLSLDRETVIFLVCIFSLIFFVAAIKYAVKVIEIQRQLDEVNREIRRCSGREKMMWLNRRKHLRYALLPFSRLRKD